MKKREVTRPYAKAHLPRVNWEAERSGELVGVLACTVTRSQPVKGVLDIERCGPGSSKSKTI